MSVEGMYQGCIMRNIRTKEGSFKVPFSSKTQTKGVTSAIIKKLMAHHRWACIDLNALYIDWLKWIDTYSKYLFLLAHFEIIDQRTSNSNDQPKAWMQASTSSSTVADCSDNMDSIVSFPFRLDSLVSLCLGWLACLALHTKQDEKRWSKAGKRE